MQAHKNTSEFWKLLGKAIATRPGDIQLLLAKRGYTVKTRDDSKELLDGSLLWLGRNDKGFNSELSQVLSSVEKNDHFIGAIAGAVGAVAGAIGSGQQKKIMKEQARAQTFSSIMAYKAQQEATKAEEIKLRQKIQDKAKEKSGFDNKTILVIVGVIVALIIVGLVVYQRNQPHITQPIIQSLKR